MGLPGCWVYFQKRVYHVASHFGMSDRDELLFQEWREGRDVWKRVRVEMAGHVGGRMGSLQRSLRILVDWIVFPDPRLGHVAILDLESPGPAHTPRHLIQSHRSCLVNAARTVVGERMRVPY